MSAYNLKFNDNTTKTVKFEKDMSIDDVKKFLINEKEPFFTINFNDKVSITIRKNIVSEFMQLNEQHISPNEKQWRIV